MFVGQDHVTGPRGYGHKRHKRWAVRGVRGRIVFVLLVPLVAFTPCHRDRASRRGAGGRGAGRSRLHWPQEAQKAQEVGGARNRVAMSFMCFLCLLWRSLLATATVHPAAVPGAEVLAGLACIGHKKHKRHKRWAVRGIAWRCRSCASCGKYFLSSSWPCYGSPGTRLPAIESHWAGESPAARMKAAPYGPGANTGASLPKRSRETPKVPRSAASA